ncbi:hypothetical protein D3878_22040 [Noviherbaspirillum sedimenti]|uniref:Uncharacterized protein n=1 Tax=Noviherbaspirillum sedimenti TaxID=2320865 RepID=A0A3A3G7J6_9BURK|nr:hypothetical protein D3878_22040 [Noviherbaspirillum sedimenti]
MKRIIDLIQKFIATPKTHYRIGDKFLYQVTGAAGQKYGETRYFHSTEVMAIQTKATKIVPQLPLGFSPSLTIGKQQISRRRH